jgi:hypothetical protein
MIRSCVIATNSEAKLTVELANEGPGAFKPNVFGKSIFITRTIKKKGGGAYSIHGIATALR